MKFVKVVWNEDQTYPNPAVLVDPGGAIFHALDQERAPFCFCAGQVYQVRSNPDPDFASVIKTVSMQTMVTYEAWPIAKIL
jgi:hypothetical protein